MARDPAVGNIGVGNTDVVGIVSNRNPCLLHARITEGIRPIVKMMDFYSFAGRDKGCPHACGWQRHHLEFRIVGNEAMISTPGSLVPLREMVVRALTKGRMRGVVVDFIGPFAKPVRQSLKSPSRMILWIHGTRGNSHIFHDLCVPSQKRNKLRTGCSKQSLANRSEAGLGRRPALLRTLIARQKCLEIDALEFLPSIDHKYPWQSLMAPNAFAKNHHARSIARRIEREKDGQHTT